MEKFILYINWIVGSLITVLFTIAIFIRLHPNYDKSSQKLSIMKDGGADGPTATFITIKLNYSFLIWIFVASIATLLILNYIIKMKK